MYDEIWIEGFDKYASRVNYSVAAPLINRGEWSSLSTNLPTIVAHDPLGAGADPTGYSIYCHFDYQRQLTRQLGRNCARVIGGFCYKRNTNNTQSLEIQFLDGATIQATLRLRDDGFLEVYRGGDTGAPALLGTSVESFPDLAEVFIAYDFTFSQTAGIAKVWLNGKLTTLNLSGQDMAVTANEYANAVRLHAVNNALYFWLDHWYLMMFDVAGSADTPFANPYVDTDYALAETALNNFVPGRWWVGPSEHSGSFKPPVTAGNTTANVIFLRQVVVPGTGNIDAVIFAPNQTTPYIPAVYADAAGAPGALLGTGPAVSASATGYTIVRAPLDTPIAVVKDQVVWVGLSCGVNNAVSFCLDTFTGHLGSVTKTHTYGNALPDPLGALSNAAYADAWFLADMSGMGADADNTKIIGTDWPRAECFIEASVSGNVEQVTFPPLRDTPDAIHAVGVKALLSASAAETVDVQLRDAVTSNGSKGAHSPGAGFTYASTYFATDPDTGAAWTKAGLEAAKGAIEIN